jgi:FtsP/CotA-like multicopper oxidase with cupredoxin domain
MLNRRDTLKIGAVAGVALAIPAGQVVDALSGTAAASAEPFTVPLPIPRELKPVFRDRAADYYNLTIKPGTARILQDKDTPVLTFNGEFPGPTIRATRGREAIVRVTNRLDSQTAVHLHGGAVPPEDDGHPLDCMEPGASRTYRYPNDQPGATLWYHDHAHHLEAEHVYRGLSGAYIIDDPRANLPTGKYDIPLALRDVCFTESGELRWKSGGAQERKTVLVNGAIQPMHNVERRKYRLRLINMANERNFRLRFGGAEFLLIGLDGGLLPVPIRTTEVFVSSAERADVIVDFGKFGSGSSVFMENVDGATATDRNLLSFQVGGERVADDAPLDLAAIAAAAPALPAKPTVAVPTRKIEFSFDSATSLFHINGKAFDPHRIDFTVKRGSTEIWEISTLGPFPIHHSLHVHLIQFRVLDRNGVPVKPLEAYPKDNVYVPFGETVRILVTFNSRYTGVYPFHCHFVDHSSIGMMAQLEIVP